MSISFESAISSLKIMFPDWDEETLSTLLMANNYHVERTIETILTMSGENVSSSSSTEISQAPVPAPAPAPAPGTIIHASQPAPTQRRNVPSSQSRPYSAPSQQRYRGIKCQLPDDFLRPPGWETTIITDEELALMLQNELFQREARAMLGDDFIMPGASQPSATHPQRQPSRTTDQHQSGGATNAPASSSSADMGIMKALSSMGSATKRNLSSLAQRFSASNTATRRPSETGNAREFRPLVESTHDMDEDEDTEVISFDSRATRSNHVLQTQQEVDSENPLLAGGNTRTI